MPTTVSEELNLTFYVHRINSNLGSHTTNFYHVVLAQVEGEPGIFGFCFCFFVLVFFFAHHRVP